MDRTIIAQAAARADQFAAMKGCAPSIGAIANLIREAKGVPGIEWIIGNCEANARHAERLDHAAQYRVIAKRLRRAIAHEMVAA